jgi:hypothetical protein
MWYVYKFIYTYHNDNVHRKDNVRDEYRISSGYFSNLNPEDIVAFFPSSEESEHYIMYRIGSTDKNYSIIKNLTTQYKIGRRSTALIPILTFIRNCIVFEEVLDIPSHEQVLAKMVEIELDAEKDVELSDFSPEALRDLHKQNLQNEGEP